MKITEKVLEFFLTHSCWNPAKTEERMTVNSLSLLKGKDRIFVHFTCQQTSSSK